MSGLPFRFFFISVFFVVVTVVVAFERPVSVVFDGQSPSAVCGASYTGYSFQLSMSCLSPSPASTVSSGASLVDAASQRGDPTNQQLPRSACSANFVTPWTPTLPKMLFIVKLTRLRVPAGSRLRILSVNSFGSPTGDPEVDVRSGNLDSFRDKHGSDYVETTGTIRILWESTNPVIDWASPCVPYALDFELSIMAYWPRWVNRTSGAYECPMSSFLCRRINYCLPKQFVGDGVNHCVDGDDELGTFPGSVNNNNYPDTNEPPSLPSSYGPGNVPGMGAGSFNSAIFVPLIIFVILCVFLAACIVRSRVACRQLALRQSTFTEACRQVFCGFRSSIRLSVRPTDRIQMPPTMRRPSANGPNGEGATTVSSNLRGSGYSSSSGFRRWQEQFLRANPSPAASVNIIPKELDMSPPSYEEALKLPTASARAIREWFGHVKLSELDVATNNNTEGTTVTTVVADTPTTEDINEATSQAPQQEQPVTSPVSNATSVTITSSNNNNNGWQPLTDQSLTSVISLSSVNNNNTDQPQISGNNGQQQKEEEEEDSTTTAPQKSSVPLTDDAVEWV